MRCSFVLALFLAACAPTNVAPADAGALAGEYNQALADGDARAAMDALRHGARAGNLDALAALVGAHERGYLTVSSAASATHLAVRSWPWDAVNVRRRYERALHEGASDDDPAAHFLMAERLLTKQRVGDAWITPPADVATARALYDRLNAARAEPFRLAVFADRLGDRDAYLAHLERAAVAGHPQACLFLSMATAPDRPYHAAATIADRIDDAEGCRVRAAGHALAGPIEHLADALLDDLRTQSGAGNPAAVATLDSLRVLGVFDRHPRLAP